MKKILKTVLIISIILPANNIFSALENINFTALGQELRQQLPQDVLDIIYSYTVPTWNVRGKEKTLSDFQEIPKNREEFEGDFDDFEPSDYAFNHAIEFLAASPDGKYLTAASSDKLVVWGYSKLASSNISR